MSILDAFRILNIEVTIYHETIIAAYNNRVSEEKEKGANETLKAVNSDGFSFEVSAVLWQLKEARDIALNWAEQKQEELREDDERGGEESEDDLTPKTETIIYR
jgi:hypothetical protein